MTYPGLGNPGEVLTVQGSSLKFLPAGITAVEALGVTVASLVPAEFTSIGAALASGNTIIHVIGDTAEASDISVAGSGLNIRLYNSAQINMQDNGFVWTGDGELSLDGNGGLAYNYTVPETLFDVGAFAGRVTADGINVTNNSSASGTLVTGANSRFSNCVLGGDVFLDGTRNELNGCNITGNLTVVATAVQAKVSHCQVDGSLVIDPAASGTVISDTDSY